MITKQQLNPHGYPESELVSANLDILLDRVNKLLALYGKPKTVTSGLRSDADQARINPAAPKSKHLTGQAVDLYDPEQELQTWIYDNFEELENIGLWCEAFQSTPNWVHMQSVPPKSGHRFFTP